MGISHHLHVGLINHLRTIYKRILVSDLLFASINDNKITVGRAHPYPRFPIVQPKPWYPVDRPLVGFGNAVTFDPISPGSLSLFRLHFAQDRIRN
jgi:hypothetical protein